MIASFLKRQGDISIEDPFFDSYFNVPNGALGVDSRSRDLGIYPDYHSVLSLEVPRTLRDNGATVRAVA